MSDNNVNEGIAASAGDMYETRDASRLEAFSDGVFAVAITLLVLDLKIPRGTATQMAGELLSLWPQYVAYLYSFTTIGVYWMNHHNMFKYIRRVDQTLMFLNILFLALVGLLPFATALLASDLGRGKQLAIDAAFIYNGIALVNAVAITGIWHYAMTRPALFDIDVKSDLIVALTKDYRLGQLFSLIALVLVFVSVPLALGLTLALNIYFSLPELLRAKKKGRITR